MSKPAQPTDPDVLDPKVSASCLDFLLIELIPLAYRLTAELAAKEQALTEELRKSQAFSRPRTAESGTVAPNALTGKDGAVGLGRVAENSKRDSGTGTAGVSSDVVALDDETREAVFWRVDSLGYRVGQGLVER